MPAKWETLPTIGPDTEVQILNGVVYVDGRVVPYYPLLDQMTAQEREAYFDKLHKAQARTKDETSQAEASAQVTGANPDEVEGDLAFLREEGFSTQQADFDLRAQLEAAGVDTDNPEVRFLIEESGEALQDPSILQILIPQLLQRYPAASATAFDSAFEASGFEGAYNPMPSPGAQQLAARDPDTRGVAAGSFTAEDVSGPVSPFRMNEDTGWLQFRSGVLVDPSGSSGRTVWYDPTSLAPGSPRWFREVVSGWGADKRQEWRQRLAKFGYLDLENTSDTHFLGALQAYHDNRYLNGGKPLSSDVAPGGAGSTMEPLVNVRREMGATIRNTVRENYRSVFGADPSDGQVQAFSDFIFKTSMEMQRQNRRKYDGATRYSTAIAEATEQGLENIFESPEARFLRREEEENTRLHDSIAAAVAATAGLA